MNNFISRKNYYLQIFKFIFSNTKTAKLMYMLIFCLFTFTYYLLKKRRFRTDIYFDGEIIKHDIRTQESKNEKKIVLKEYLINNFIYFLIEFIISVIYYFFAESFSAIVQASLFRDLLQCRELIDPAIVNQILNKHKEAYCDSAKAILINGVRHFFILILLFRNFSYKHIRNLAVFCYILIILNIYVIVFLFRNLSKIEAEIADAECKQNISYQNIIECKDLIIWNKLPYRVKYDTALEEKSFFLQFSLNICVVTLVLIPMFFYLISRDSKTFIIHRTGKDILNSLSDLFFLIFELESMRIKILDSVASIYIL